MAEEISRNINRINQVTEQTASGATQTAAASHDLSRLAGGTAQSVGALQGCLSQHRLISAFDMGISDSEEDAELCRMVSLLVLAEHISYRFRKRTDFNEWHRAGEKVLTFLDVQQAEFDELRGEMEEELASHDIS